MAKVWNPTLPGYCNNLEAHLIYGGIPNTITDVAMLLLPLPALSKLNVEKHVKVGVIATFLIGLLYVLTVPMIESLAKLRQRTHCFHYSAC